MPITLYRAHKQSRNIRLLFHTFKLNLEIWVELYSRHFARGLLFIRIVYPTFTINGNNIIENIDTIHNILTAQTGGIHYSC